MSTILYCVMQFDNGYEDFVLRACSQCADRAQLEADELNKIVPEKGHKAFVMKESYAWLVEQTTSTRMGVLNDTLTRLEALVSK